LLLFTSFFAIAVPFSFVLSRVFLLLPPPQPVINLYPFSPHYPGLYDGPYPPGLFFTYSLSAFLMCQVVAPFFFVFTLFDGDGSFTTHLAFLFQPFGGRFIPGATPSSTPNAALPCVDFNSGPPTIPFFVTLLNEESSVCAFPQASFGCAGLTQISYFASTSSAVPCYLFSVLSPL